MKADMCAKEDCHAPVLTTNAISVPLCIGDVVIPLCQEHFALYLERMREQAAQKARKPARDEDLVELL